MMRPRQRWILPALAAAALLWCAAPGAAFEIFGFRLWGKAAEDESEFEIIDPLPFTVEVTVQGGADDLTRIVERASGLYSGQDQPASGTTGLLARAKGDYRRILAALYNNAYYGGEISILLAGREAAELNLDSPMPAEVPVRITVRPGPRFRFGVAEVVNPPPPNPRRDTEASADLAKTFRRGAQADATVISAVSDDAVQRWRVLSYAKAGETERSVVADHATRRLDAVITLEPGRKADYGKTIVRGTRRMDPGFVAYMADLPEGASFDPDRVRAAEERLGRLGVFRSIRIEEAETIAPDGALDMTVRVEDGPPRSIGFGATLSTIEGAGLEAFWMHRNLFGRAERLRFEASVTGLGITSNGGDFDYTAGVSFLRPGVINPNVDFIASLTGRRLDLDTYREELVTARVGLQRTFARFINGELSAYATKARYEDFFGTRDFLMVGVRATGDYDRRNDKLDPTRGYYLQAELTPFYEFDYGNTAARGALEGRIYRAVDAEDRFVLAARAKIGSYVGPPDSESPPDQLFFAGGAGSIRGYAFRSVGVEITNANGKTGVVGGRSLVEGSGELRVRIDERFGAVGFLDAGYVSSTSTLSGGDDSDLRAGAGAGVRYFTGLGPLRLDVATPINPREDDSLDRGLHRHRAGVLRRILAILGLAVLLGVAALAQDPGGADPADDNGFVINFLQNTISAPGRQIRLNGVTGALSSRARIASLSIADDDGVWLRLDGVEIDWSRLALLRGRVSINRLAIERIEFLRRPVPHVPKLGERLPKVAARPFALPELPVSVQVAALELPRIDIAAPVLGQAAQLGATGAADLARGALTASLDVRRLDAPGALTLALDFSNATRALDIDLNLQEPQGGVIATLLDIEDRPAIDLRVQGAGPLDALDVDVTFDAGGARIARGRRGAAGRRRGPELHRRSARRAGPGGPRALPPFLRRRDLGRIRRRAARRRRRAARPARAARRGARSLRRAGDRAGRISDQPHARRPARRSARPGDHPARPRRRDHDPLVGAASLLWRRAALERAGDARPAGCGRRRDRGPDAHARRRRREPRRPGAAQPDLRARGRRDRGVFGRSRRRCGAGDAARPLRGRGASARRSARHPPGAGQRPGWVGVRRRRDAGARVRRPARGPARGPRSRFGPRRARSRRGARLADDGIAQPAQRRLRPRARRRRAEPPARRSAARRAARRRNDAGRPGRARRRGISHRRLPPRQPPGGDHFDGAAHRGGQRLRHRRAPDRSRGPRSAAGRRADRDGTGARDRKPRQRHLRGRDRRGPAARLRPRGRADRLRRSGRRRGGARRPERRRAARRPAHHSGRRHRRRRSRPRAARPVGGGRAEPAHRRPQPVGGRSDPRRTRARRARRGSARHAGADRGERRAQRPLRLPARRGRPGGDDRRHRPRPRFRRQRDRVAGPRRDGGRCSRGAAGSGRPDGFRPARRGARDRHPRRHRPPDRRRLDGLHRAHPPRRRDRRRADRRADATAGRVRSDARHAQPATERDRRPARGARDGDRRRGARRTDAARPRSRRRPADRPGSDRRKFRRGRGDPGAAAVARQHGSAGARPRRDGDRLGAHHRPAGDPGRALRRDRRRHRVGADPDGRPAALADDRDRTQRRTSACSSTPSWRPRDSTRAPPARSRSGRGRWRWTSRSPPFRSRSSTAWPATAGCRA